jgi:hypothetical protein
MYGSSEVTLQFSTNEITEANTVIFTHGETLYCYFNNHQRSFALGSATSYSFHVAIPSLPFTYKCNYHYFQNGHPEAGNIFIFNSPHSPLLPVLHRPVGNNSNFMVKYQPGNPSPVVNTCTVQVTANAPNGNVNGDTVSQDGNTYTGPDVSSLNGLGNIVMTRTCTPIHIVNNSDECGCPPGTKFAAVNVTYTSTASYEVSWVPPSTPSQSTTS